MVELSEFQKALAQGDYGEAQRIRDLRTPIEAGTFEGWLSPDKIGMWGHKIQPVLIYPKMTPEQLQRSGQFDTMGEKNFIWTGNWKLDDSQFQELDKNLNRALSESGLEVLPTQIKNSGQDLTSWRISERPEPELGVSYRDYGEGVVPMYIVRGMGNYAGATPGTAEFGHPFAQVGDSVIEALAGYSGPTAFSRYLQEIDGLPADEANYMASRQAQMGTVLHEAMHMTGALPHTGDEGYYQDYTTNYGGQHGENFMHAITNDIRGKRSDDVGEAMRLVMGEPWNYGWGTDANPDGMTGNPITNKDEFKANVEASPHPHPHPKPHTSPGETRPISRSTVTTEPLQPEPIVPTPQDIVESTPEPTEVTETMADNVPFKKINGVWHVMDRDTGNWETNDAWQAALEGVTKVTRNKENGRPQFHYQASPGYDFEGGSTPEGIYTADQMRARYESMAGSQETAQNIDLEEAWFNTFNIEIPDIFQRGQLDEVLYDSYTTNRQGERVPAEGAQPLIDADKLQEVLGMLEGRGALGLQEPVVVTVPGVEDAFVSVGGQTFKSKKSATGQPGATNIQDIPGTDYRMITSPTGTVSTVKKSDPTYAPGVIAETGPGSIDLPGYDILQDREGGLTPYTQRYDPSFIVDSKTMMPYFQQPDGKLEVADMPSMDDLITQYLVSGQTGKAVAMANFRDRPTSLEYFNAAMEWARSPADVFTVSAIVRGMFQPEPGPMGELRRIGAPPSWARDAWVALQSSMGIAAQDITSEPGAEEGSFVAGGGDPSVVPTIQSEFGVPNVSATDQTVTTSSAEQLYAGTGLTVEEQGQAAAQDADLTGEDPAAPMDVDSIIEKFQTETVPFQPQLEEYDEFAASMSDTGFRFGDVQGISREDLFNADGTGILDILEIDNPEAFALAEQIFQGQGGIENAGAFFDSVQGLENAINYHLTGIRGMDAIDLDDSGAEESVKKPPEDPTEDPTEIPGPPAIDTGLPYEYGGIDSDDEYVESEADRVARIGTGATLPTTTTPADLFDEAVADDSWMFGSAGGDDYYVPPGAYSSPLSAVTSQSAPTAAVEPTGVITGKTDPVYGRNADGDWVVIEPSELIYGPGPLSESDLFFLGLEEAQEVQEVPEFFPASSLGERRELPFEDTQPTPNDIGMYGGGDDYYDEIGFLQEPTQADLIEKYWEPLGSPMVTPTATPMPVATSTAAPTPTPLPAEVVNEPYGDDWFPGQVSEHEIDMVEAWQAMLDEPMPEELYQLPPEPVDDNGDRGFMDRVAEIIPFWDPTPVGGPESEIPYVSPYPGGASGEAYWSGYDEGAEGIRTGDRFTLVGEEGPELALFPRGTEIVPLNRPAKPKQRKRLRSQFSDEIDSFAFGGFSDGGTALVGEMGPELVDLPPGAQVMPAGITEMMTGRPTRAPRSLFRQAGMRAPSAQTISNLLPEEIEVYQEMGRLAGIPEKAFEREFRSMVPMGQGGTRQARFTPRGTGRTRYGRR